MQPRERAQSAFRELKLAILEILEFNPHGLGNAEIADALDLRTDYAGGGKDYLTWSVLGVLLNEGLITRSGRKYLVASKTNSDQSE
jgi:uncharacterized protein